MMLRKRMMKAMVLIIMLCTLCVSSVLAEENKKDENGVTILFTHDMHSHMDEFSTGKGSVGGFARLKTAIEEKRAENPATFLFDGGDFSMGTLYQTIYEEEASELTMMGRLGYDAVTFGNHEFDYRSTGVSNMFHSAIENAKADPTVILPQFVAANIDWEKNNTKDNQLIEQALKDYGSKPYTVIEREGVKVGVYGVLGEDADKSAPESGIVFDSIVDTSKKIVKELQKEDVDMIVCLSHSGTREDKDKSEDEILAKEVPEIDVIVSAHTHTKLDTYIQSGDTYIVSGGFNGEYLGEFEMKPKKDGRWEPVSYSLKHMDETVAQDEETQNQLNNYKRLVDEEYLSKFGYTFDKVLAQNDVEFTQKSEFASELKEDPLGSIIADAYIYAVEQAEGDKYEKVDAALAPSGTIRDTLQKGQLTVSDAFNICSLGIGADRIPGYPLVSVYLTGKELKTVAEIDASISPIMTTAQLYPSGMSWTYNPNRMILNRVLDVKLTQNVPYSEEKQEEKIEDDKLYRVAAGLYSAQMLGAVEDTSKGLLKITPKDKDGKPIEDFDKYIIHDQNGAELKEWYALAAYLESFDKNADGISQVPERYGSPEGRKAEIDSKNIVDLVKKPNKFMFIICGAVLVLLLAVILIVRFIIKKRKKRNAAN